MLIVALKELSPHEKRIALTPDVVKRFLDLGFQVAIEAGAGQEAGYSDELYEKSGATLEKKRKMLLEKAGLVLTVSPLEKEDIFCLKKGTLVVGLLKPHQNNDSLPILAKAKVTSFSLDLLPRITRAQAMDVLSSQSNLAGYKAVVDAASEFGRAFPLMMTAAGTVPAAKVLILGAGVAGLQAIATARRLGAIVSAFDVRTVTKEQVQSLGATFVEVEAIEDEDDKSGYAKEMSEAYKKAQAQKLAQVIKDQDVIITTAQIPGKPAPILMTLAMVKSMKPGSVIIDLAAESGGNCSETVWGKTVVKHGITIIGPANILSRIAGNASQLYSRNLFNFVKNLFLEGAALNWQDELVTSTALTHDGKIVYPHFSPLKES